MNHGDVLDAAHEFYILGCNVLTVSYRGCASFFYFLPFSLPTFLIEGTATPLVLPRKRVSVSYHIYIHL